MDNNANICNDCRKPFEKASDDTVEVRCPECQAQWRIANAAKALVDPLFAWHYRASRGNARLKGMW